MPYVDPMLHKSEVKRLLHNLGYQIHCHCNGDAGADMFIHAVAEALAENPRSDHRHTIIHGQVLREDQLDRIAELDMTISFFSAHVYFWGICITALCLAQIEPQEYHLRLLLKNEVSDLRYTMILLLPLQDLCIWLNAPLNEHHIKVEYWAKNRKLQLFQHLER